MTRQQSLQRTELRSQLQSREQNLLTGSRRLGFHQCIALLLLALMGSLGCHPTQPFYFHEDGDFSHYLDRATEIEYTEVDNPRLAEVDHAMTPYRISRPENLEPWDLTLEEVVSIALQNSKIIKNNGNLQQLLNSQQSGFVSTVYDTAIAESDPENGVEAALAAFDAQLNVLGTSNGNIVSTQDRPTTFALGGGSNIITQTAGGIRAEVAKRSAGGTQYFARSITEYTRGNTFGGINQAIGSIWQQSLELEVRQPILRGRGAAVNRVPVILARINTDISLANFEANVRNMVLDVERAYWDLYTAYRTLDANTSERDAAQKLWKVTKERFTQGVADALQMAQADQQYFDFRARLEDALRAVYNSEANLRLLMGLSPTDGRIIRPIDEPTIADVEFDWCAIHNEALIRSAELRQQKWRIQAQETQLIAAKNQLLPQFDLGVTYRWFGIGDELINADRNGLNFPETGSTAWDVLTEGDFQESAFFMQFALPVGFRRELARVRNVQLLIARERARLEEMELATVHQLTVTLQNLDAFQQLAKTRFNHWKAADDEFNAAASLFIYGRGTLEPVLDAQRRRSEAQREYYRILSEYNKAIADVHFRKGSLLEYNNIVLAEGPWPEKAYWDAQGLARQRDASYYLDYGWSRPGVISHGPVEQHFGMPGSEYYPEGESMEEIAPGESTQPTPADPMGTPPATDGDGTPPTLPPAREPGPITSRPEGPMLNAPVRRASAVDSETGSRPVSRAAFNWSGLQDETSSSPANPLR